MEIIQNTQDLEPISIQLFLQTLSYPTTLKTTISYANSVIYYLIWQICGQEFFSHLHLERLLCPISRTETYLKKREKNTVNFNKMFLQYI